MEQFAVFIVAVIAATWDLKYRRIPNWLTFPAMMLGIILNTLHGRLLGALFGLAFGFIVMFWPWFKGWLGAGDVKLAMAFGALQGWPLILESLLWGTLAGGIVGALVLLSKGRLSRFFHSLAALAIAKITGVHADTNEVVSQGSGTMPYGVFLGFGAVLTFFLAVKGIKVLP